MKSLARCSEKERVAYAAWILETGEGKYIEQHKKFWPAFDEDKVFEIFLSYQEGLEESYALAYNILLDDLHREFADPNYTFSVEERFVYAERLFKVDYEMALTHLFHCAHLRYLPAMVRIAEICYTSSGLLYNYDLVKKYVTLVSKTGSDQCRCLEASLYYTDDSEEDRQKILEIIEPYRKNFLETKKFSMNIYFAFMLLVLESFRHNTQNSPEIHNLIADITTAAFEAEFYEVLPMIGVIINEFSVEYAGNDFFEKLVVGARKWSAICCQYIAKMYLDNVINKKFSRQEQEYFLRCSGFYLSRALKMNFIISYVYIADLLQGECRTEDGRPIALLSYLTCDMQKALHLLHVDAVPKKR